MLSFFWSLIRDMFRKPKPVHFHGSGLTKSAFQRRVEAQLATRAHTESRVGIPQGETQ